MFRSKLNSVGQILPKRGITATNFWKWKSTAASQIESLDSDLSQTQVDRELGAQTFSFSSPFSRSKRGTFFQQQPTLRNSFLEDITLRSYLRRHLPKDIYDDIKPDLEQFGDRVTSDIYELAIECDTDLPRLEQQDAWGNRVDEIYTCPAWKKMHDFSAQEGLIAIGYERKHAEFSRLHQMAKLYMYGPSAGLYNCPLAMTDGAAKSFEVMGKPGLFRKAFENLTTRVPSQFWTSGQWMTERKGGSDVANGTETLAVPQADGSYKLYGYKWFSSATDSDMTLTLARITDEQGKVTQGTKGLSMFYLEVRNKDGSLNNIEVQRLKSKLGTRQVPTAELLLYGTKAYLASPLGRGVASISVMLTISRVYNAIMSAADMRRIVNLARDYSHQRRAFGKHIKDYPLHIKTLANMEVEARASCLLVMELARLLGRDELNKTSDNEKQLFRLMTPVAKLITAKQAVAVVSEGLECFGGQGYMEDTGLPRMLRDAQVMPIWEGTTNILSLDVLRSIVKSNGGVLKAFHTDINHRMSSVTRPELVPFAEKLIDATNSIIKFASENDSASLEVAAREFAFSIGNTYMGSLMVEHADWAEATPQDMYAAKRWCERDLVPMVTEQVAGNYDNRSVQTEYDLVMDSYTGNQSKL